MRAGKIDSAEGLAKLLIPNVREWYADRSDCGPGGDGDGAPVPIDDKVTAAFAGSELEGLGADSLQDLVAGFLRAHLTNYDLRRNDEFRDHFAARLRHSVARRELDNALLLLSNDGERQARYFRFADVRRLTKPQAAALSSRAAGCWLTGSTL